MHEKFGEVLEDSGMEESEVASRIREVYDALSSAEGAVELTELFGLNYSAVDEDASFEKERGITTQSDELKPDVPAETPLVKTESFLVPQTHLDSSIPMIDLDTPPPKKLVCRADFAPPVPPSPGSQDSHGFPAVGEADDIFEDE